MLDFVAQRRLARGDQRRLRRGLREVDQPGFRGLVIVHRDFGEAARLQPRG